MFARNLLRGDFLSNIYIFIDYNMITNYIQIIYELSNFNHTLSEL